MSDAEKPADKPKKGKKLLVVLLGVVALAAGAGGGIYASGMLGGGHKAEAHEDEHLPKLKVREGVDEEEAESYAASHKGKSPNPKLFQASYYQLKDNLTANFGDSDAFLQVGVGVSTYYDDQVLKAVETHEMAVRSAILMTLADQDMMKVTTPEGKVELKQELKKAVNDVLEQKEGFGGIDDVYFTSFVVQ